MEFAIKSQTKTKTIFDNNEFHYSIIQLMVDTVVEISLLHIQLIMFMTSPDTSDRM